MRDDWKLTVTTTTGGKSNGEELQKDQVSEDDKKKEYIKTRNKWKGETNERREGEREKGKTNAVKLD